MKKITVVLCFVVFMLVSFTAEVEYQRGDVDQNGKVDIGDVTCLIDYLLSGSWDEGPVVPPEEEHEWVDLGLPSGTLWATCNVGANSPEEYGDYFAWGETEPKEVYTWQTYVLCGGTSTTMNKYCSRSDYGAVDNKTELEPVDDAAYVNWGSSWRIPTQEQQNELRLECTWTATQLNGVKGRMVTGPNGNKIFLPAAGHYGNSTHYNAGTHGSYWSRMQGGGGDYNARYLHFLSGQLRSDFYYRYFGMSIRPVRAPQE